MPSSDTRHLIFLERQYDEIKPLIPVANALLAAGHADSKYAKNTFRIVSSFWDQLTGTPQIKLPIHEIPPEEKEMLLKVLMLAMAYLVEVRRASETAVQALKIAKYDLMRLLGNLSTQVLAETNFSPVPAFSQLSHPSKLKDASAKEFGKRNREVKLIFDQLAQQRMNSIAIGFGTRSILQEIIRCIGHFAIPDPELLVKMQFEQKTCIKKAKSCGKRSHLAQAYLQIQAMNTIRFEQIIHLSERSAALAEKLKQAVLDRK
jgi:hypothetical protein